NTYTTSDQEYPSIAALPNGGFVIAWHSVGQDGSGSGVYMKRFPCGDEAPPEPEAGEACMSTQKKAEFMVNSNTTGNQTDVKVATLDNGNVIATWADNSGLDGADWGIFAQMFDPDGFKIGNEFQVNTYTIDSQMTPDIASIANGGFTIAWTSTGQDGDDNGVYAQRFDAYGNKTGNEFRVNTHTTNAQGTPSVAAFAEGGFVITWQSDLQDSDDSGVYAQRYDADGNAIGNEFRVNTHTASKQNASFAATLAGGDFIITWQSENQDGDNMGIYAQQYDANGNTVGNEFQVNTYTAESQWTPSVAALTGGGFVITWTSGYLVGAFQDGDSYGVFAQQYDANGNTVGNEFQVNTYTTNQQFNSSVAPLAGGGFIISWSSLEQDGNGYGIFSQRYDANGNTVGEEFQVNAYTAGDQRTPSVTGLNDGGYFIAWDDLGGRDGDAYGVFAATFPCSTSEIPNYEPDPVCTTITKGPEELVNTTTAGDQDFPAVAGLNNGYHVIIWEDQSGIDGDSHGIFGQLYNDKNVKVGSEFQVNTYTTSTQSDPAVTDLAGGGFVVAWKSNAQDGDLTGIYAQIYDNLGIKVGNEFRINTITTGYQGHTYVEHNYITGLKNGTFVVAWSDSRTGEYDIYAQIFTAGGSKIGTEFRVNNTVAGEQIRPQVTSHPDGGFISVWSSDEQDGDLFGAYGQRYDAYGNKVGAEFQVNTTTTDYQYSRDVITLTDGRFVIGWQSLNQDGNKYGTYLQLYDANGNKIGGEIQINTTTLLDQFEVRLLPMNDGGFVAIWHSEDQDGSGYAIVSRRFDANGNKVDDESVVNTTTDNNQHNPNIALLKDGGYVITWASEGQDLPAETTNHGIYQKVFPCGDDELTQPAILYPCKKDIRVNTTTADAQIEPEIAVLADDKYVVVWENEGLNGGDIMAQLYDADGNKLGNEFTVHAASNDNDQPAVAALSDGGFVISWNSDDAILDDIFAQRYDNTGKAVDAQFQVNTTTNLYQQRAALTGLSDGGFVITWSDSALDGDSYGVYMQRYDRNGNTAGVETRVSTETAYEQIDSHIAALKDNKFVIVWQSQIQDTSGFGIHMQLFNADGTKDGVETLVNTYVTNDQDNPSVAGLSNGDFVVAWESMQQDGDFDGIYGQMYNADGSTNGSEFNVNKSISHSQRNPKVIGDPSGGFSIAWDDYDGTEHFVRMTRYDAAGNKLNTNDPILNAYDLGNQELPAIGVQSNGTIIGAWQSNGQNEGENGYDIYRRTFSADGQCPAAPTSIANDIQVNTTTTGNQQNPAITGLEDGSFVIAWEDSAKDGDDYGIVAQRFDAYGSKLGNEFQVNTYTAYKQQHPSVTALTGGGFVITWQSDAQDGFWEGIYTQRYDADGNTVGSETLVNTHTADNQVEPSVIALANGGFMVTWQSLGQDGDGYGIYYQIYDASGNTVGSETPVNTYTTSGQQYPSVAAFSDGGFIIAWQSDGQDGDGNGIYYQRFNADGSTNGSETLVNVGKTASDQIIPDIIVLSDGKFAIAWEDENGYDSDQDGAFIQVYNADGSTDGASFNMNSFEVGNQQEPAISSLEDKGFVATWNSQGQDGSGTGIFAQRFNADKTTFGAEFQVSNYTAGNQYNPAIATVNSGIYVVAWTDDGGQDSDGTGVFMKIYPAPHTTTPATPTTDTPVNTETTDSQAYPDVAKLNSGNFVITWTSTAQDLNGDGVYAQIYDYEGNAVGSEFRVNTETANDQQASNVTALKNGGFVITWQSRDQDGSDFGTYAQIFDANGTKVGAEFRANTETVSYQYGPSTAALAGGGFVIIWASDQQDGSATGTYYQLYDDNGTEIGVERLANTSTIGRQSGPSIAALSNGGFVVTWQESNLEDAWGINAQRFDASGTKVGVEFRVNTETTGSQVWGSVTALTNGGFVITWSSNGQDVPAETTNYGIYGQIYNADGSINGAEFRINTTTADSQEFSSISTLSDGGFIVTWQSR
ncbi:MAG: hypothetical protein GY799_11300, partial [Desulfobulbaceae bacterium]|nr:hypothetical protein [Desulfobulbaceae bacterium]